MYIAYVYVCVVLLFLKGGGGGGRLLSCFYITHCANIYLWTGRNGFHWSIVSILELVFTSKTFIYLYHLEYHCSNSQQSG